MASPLRFSDSQSIFLRFDFGWVKVVKKKWDLIKGGVTLLFMNIFYMVFPSNMT